MDIKNLLALIESSLKLGSIALDSKVYLSSDEGCNDIRPAICVEGFKLKSDKKLSILFY